MKLSIGTRPARAAALVSVAARLFIGLAVDAPTTHNGIWLCALIGGLLAVPWLLCMSHVRMALPLCGALAAFALWDASRVFAMLSRSAGYLALDRAPTWVLLVPAGLTALWSVTRNGDAVGYGAMVWLRIAPALLLLVALLQVRFFRTEWLRPWLGEGRTSIWEGSVRSAGWIVAASAVLCAADERSDSRSALPAITASEAIAAGLMILRLMMTPTQLLGDNWLNRLDSLLCNGFAPLYLQLPMIVLWFAGLMHLIVCEVFSSAALVQRLLPSVDGRLCAAILTGIALILSRTHGSETISPWSFSVVCVLGALHMLMRVFTGRRSGCE